MTTDSQLLNPIYFLAIDNGTQSVRALIFDQLGNEIAKARVPLDAYFSLRAGYAEQHGEYWEQLGKACQDCGKPVPIFPRPFILMTLQG